MNSSHASEYVAVPATGHGPGVLVLHAWWGLTGFVREVCDRLAGEGFVALAPDLFDGAVATTPEQAQKLIEQWEGEATAGKVEAAYDRLRLHPAVRGERTGVMGFSFGAAYALWLADHRAEDMAAAVVFYGTPGDMPFRPAQAPCLGHFAEQDPFEPAEGVQALRERLRSAGHSVSFYVYPGTGHWFFERDRSDAFDEPAAELAWQRTRDFLQEALGAREKAASGT